MIKKLFISAVILTALIHAKESNAVSQAGAASVDHATGRFAGQVASQRSVLPSSGIARPQG